MRFQTELLALTAVLGSASALYDLPAAPARRSVKVVDYFTNDESIMQRRGEHDATLDLSFSKSDADLVGINLGSDSFDVHCNECTSEGEITTTADFPSFSGFLGDLFSSPSDIFHESSLGLSFSGVSANIDVNISASAHASHTFPLYKSETPIGIEGAGFQIGVVFQVDVIIDADGEIETHTGFQVSIPDGSSVTIPLDDSSPTITNFDQSSVSLLPATIEGDAKVKVSLRLTVQAGVELPDMGILDATAIAGAYVSIPEVILTGAFDSTSTCEVPVGAEIDINAGAFVDVGASIEGFQIGAYTPSALTTVFAAQTTGCFDSASPTVAAQSSGPAAYSYSAQPTSFSVAARTVAARTGLPITMTKLATPITNLVAAATATPAL